MHKKSFIFTLLFCVSISIFSQSETITDPFIRKQSVYAEGGGSFGAYSLNYEYKFTLSGLTRLATGGGVSFLSLSTSNLFLLGAPINLLIGQKHNFETGIAPIYVFGDTSQGEFRGIGKNLILSLRAGYRYEHPSGLLFRVGFTPFLDANNKPFRIIPSGGISLGYSF